MTQLNRLLPLLFIRHVYHLSVTFVNCITATRSTPDKYVWIVPVNVDTEENLSKESANKISLCMRNIWTNMLKEQWALSGSLRDTTN